MPDTRLTWANLKEHLRRCCVIYAVLIVAAVILSNLLWTMTTPRVPEDERILIYLADSYTDPLPLEALSEALLEETRAFDPAIREVSFESMMFSDTEGDEMFDTLCVSHTNEAHFESMDCPLCYFHTITEVSGSRYSVTRCICFI